jgi:hypothetical protein
MTYNITVRLLENGQSFVDDVLISGVANKDEALKQYDLMNDGGEILEVFEVVNTSQILAV